MRLYLLKIFNECPRKNIHQRNDREKQGNIQTKRINVNNERAF